MSSFLHRLGERCARHPFRVFAVWLVAVIAVLGAQRQFGGREVDNLRVPGVESQHANDVLARSFAVQSGQSGDLVFHVDHGVLSAPANRAAIEASVAQIAKGSDVTAVADPFDPGRPTVSADGRTAFATVNYSRQSLNKVNVRQAFAAAAVARQRGVQTELTGSLSQVHTVDGKELVGLLVAIVVLLVAFGSLMAAGIPIGTALIGLAIGLGGVGILAGVTQVPTASTLLASMIGLGVGIDYALFVVTRHRQHLHEGMSPVEAAAKANATAGQSVLFAGMTVVIAIAGLVMSGIPAIATMGLSAALVVVVSMLVAVTLLPALLGLVGTRLDRWSLPHRRPAVGQARETWSARWAHHVGRRPWRYAAVSLAALVALAAPVAGLRIGFADDSNTPAQSTAHRAYDLLANGFGRGFNGPLAIVLQEPAGVSPKVLGRIGEAVAHDPGVAAVEPPMLNSTGRVAVVTVLPTTSPQEPTTATTVNRLRHAVLPGAVRDTGATVMVTGRTAMFDDMSARLTDRLPWFIAAVVLLSFVLLMVVFRSILVPLKAAFMNLLSIGAAYGVIVAVFQWGLAKGLFGLHSTMPINPFVPMIMFAILFGLSMDYEVFLLSRVREEFQRTGDSHASVVDGLASTARVITSAALIMISVFLAFVGGSDVTVKMFGLGLATAVLIDATLVRMVLVPATMSLLGNANWWLPAWLDRRLPHMDLEGSDDVVAVVTELPEPEPVAA
jgi:RND superfamily putative drug exporter